MEEYDRLDGYFTNFGRKTLSWHKIEGWPNIGKAIKLFEDLLIKA